MHRNLVTPQDLASNDPDVLEVLDKHQHCFSYVAYLHHAQKRGLPTEEIRSFEEALQIANIPFKVLRLEKDEYVEMDTDHYNEKEEPRNVQNLKKKRKRLIEDFFESFKKAREQTYITAASTEPFYFKLPEDNGKKEMEVIE